MTEATNEPLLAQPCRCCHGTRKSCTMNCGLTLGDKRTHAEILRECGDCDTCSCRWNRIGGLQSVVTTATEILPAGYRLSIDIDRDRCTTSIINPQGKRRVIDSEGYLAADVRAAIDKAIAAEAPRKLW